MAAPQYSGTNSGFSGISPIIGDWRQSLPYYAGMAPTFFTFSRVFQRGMFLFAPKRPTVIYAAWVRAEGVEGSALTGELVVQEKDTAFAAATNKSLTNLVDFNIAAAKQQDWTMRTMIDAAGRDTGKLPIIWQDQAVGLFFSGTPTAANILQVSVGLVAREVDVPQRTD